MRYNLNKAVQNIQAVRSDLSRETLVTEVHKLASQSEETLLAVLEKCYRLACEGEPMPWEKEE